MFLATVKERRSRGLLRFCRTAASLVLHPTSIRGLVHRPSCSELVRLLHETRRWGMFGLLSRYSCVFDSSGIAALVIIVF